MEIAPKTTKEVVIECPECSGFGRIGDGPFTMGVECSQCDGRGLCDISKNTEEVVRTGLH